MIDTFSLALSHALLALAAWRLLRRPDLDAEAPGGAPPPRGRVMTPMQPPIQPGARPGA